MHAEEEIVESVDDLAPHEQRPIGHIDSILRVNVENAEERQPGDEEIFKDAVFFHIQNVAGPAAKLKTDGTPYRVHIIVNGIPAELIEVVADTIISGAIGASKYVHYENVTVDVVGNDT